MTRLDRRAVGMLAGTVVLVAVMLPLAASREEAFERGWFGTVTPLARPRVGDVVVACRDDHAILSATDFPIEPHLVGMHGSLTPDEMLVPILVA